MSDSSWRAVKENLVVCLYDRMYNCVNKSLCISRHIVLVAKKSVNLSVLQFNVYLRGKYQECGHNVYFNSFSTEYYLI